MRNVPRPPSRYVIAPEVAIALARHEVPLLDEHELLAPTLFRSQVLSLLYQAVARGETTKADADQQLGYVRSLRMRLLGDRVLQSVAWKIAADLGWADTFDAEYVALTRLQADALVTLNEDLARAVAGVVAVAPLDALTRSAAP